MLLLFDPLGMPMKTDIPALYDTVHDLLVFRVLLGNPESELLRVEVGDNDHVVLVFRLREDRRGIATEGKTVERAGPDQVAPVLWPAPLVIEVRQQTHVST